MTLSKEKVEKIFACFEKNNSQPQPELEYINNYTLLVAVALSAQATDIQVNKATKELFKVVQTPSQMVELGEEKLITYIKSIGLYKTKAKNVINLSKILVAEHNSKVPNSKAELVKLPGVGIKTANVVLNIAFGQKTIAVDTHVFRVSNRLGIVNEKTVEKTEQALMKAVPQKYLLNAHHWLILHGRYTCKAQKPNCQNCFLTSYCKTYKDSKLT